MRNQHFIRRWRIHRGLSQTKLAEKMGVERSYVSRIENGDRPYNQDFLEDASAVLGCSPVDLLIRDPDDPEGLWAIYDLLLPQQRRQLVKIGRTFIAEADTSRELPSMAAENPTPPFIRDDES